jgi:DHA2 family multidrug resistance protein-like MFS transporter
VSPPAPDAPSLLARLTILLGVALVVLDASMVNVALPAMAGALHIDPADVVWAVKAYQLAVLALLLPFAALGDRLGHRRVCLAGFALFVVASVGSMLAGSLPALAAARALQGVAAAAVMSGNTALVRLAYPDRQLGRGLALNAATVAGATAAGPSLGGLILSVAPWPVVFAPAVPLGLLFLAIGVRTLPRNPPGERAVARIGPLDVVLNAAMFGLLFIGAGALGAAWRPDGAPGAAVQGSVGAALACLAAGIAVGVVYIRRERRKAVPLFPVDLLRIRIFALSICSSLGAFGAYTIATIALPFLMLAAWGFTPAQTGLAMTAWPLALMATAAVVAPWIGRVPGGLLGGIGMGTMAAALLLLATLPAQPSIWSVAWRLVIGGIGFGLFQSPNNHIIVSSPPASRAGAASGMLATARLSGQTSGAVVAAVVFGLAPVADGRGPTLALAVAAALAVVAAGFSLLRLRERAPA